MSIFLFFKAFPHTDLVHRTETHIGESKRSQRFPWASALQQRTPSGFTLVTVVPRLLADSDAGARSRDVGILVGVCVRRFLRRAFIPGYGADYCKSGGALGWLKTTNTVQILYADVWKGGREESGACIPDDY